MQLRVISANAADIPADAPEWVHLLPLGEIFGRDGRKYTVSNPEALISVFQSGKIDLPIDFEHQSETHKDTRTGPVPAAGWIKELKVKEDGIWGRVEWTVTAQNMIRGKQYRFRSPVLNHWSGQTEVLALKGAGLVHHPNLPLTARASQEGTMETPQPFTAKLAQLVGLPATATEADVMAKIKQALTAMPDPEKYVPMKVMQSVMADRNMQSSQQSELRITDKIEDAVRKGHILPPMREWATALCRQSETSFDQFIAGSVPAYGHLLTTTHATALPPGQATRTAGADSTNAADVCRQLGLSADALND